MSHDPVEDLRQEIAKGHVLVVVGSGVSIGATKGNPLASWTGLLEDGVERCVKVRGLDSKWAGRVKAPGSRGKKEPPRPIASPGASRLPGKPRCFGRDDEVRDLVETLLQPSPPPTPILGGPGVGKTTVTLEALHDRRVVERFRARRFFVPGTGSRANGPRSRQCRDSLGGGDHRGRGFVVVSIRRGRIGARCLDPRRAASAWTTVEILDPGRATGASSRSRGVPRGGGRVLPG
jgi:hypothetical protein